MLVSKFSELCIECEYFVSCVYEFYTFQFVFGDLAE